MFLLFSVGTELNSFWLLWFIYMRGLMGKKWWIALSDLSILARNSRSLISPSFPRKIFVRIPIFHFPRFLLFTFMRTTSPGLKLLCIVVFLLIPCLFLSALRYSWDHLFHTASYKKWCISVFFTWNFHQY